MRIEVGKRDELLKTWAEFDAARGVVLLRLSGSRSSRTGCKGGAAATAGMQCFGVRSGKTEDVALFVYDVQGMPKLVTPARTLGSTFEVCEWGESSAARSGRGGSGARLAL